MRTGFVAWREDNGDRLFWPCPDEFMAKLITEGGTIATYNKEVRAVVGVRFVDLDSEPDPQCLAQ